MACFASGATRLAPNLGFFASFANDGAFENDLSHFWQTHAASVAEEPFGLNVAAITARRRARWGFGSDTIIGRSIFIDAGHALGGYRTGRVTAVALELLHCFSGQLFAGREAGHFELGEALDGYLTHRLRQGDLEAFNGLRRHRRCAEACKSAQFAPAHLAFKTKVLLVLANRADHTANRSSSEEGREKGPPHISTKPAVEPPAFLFLGMRLPPR